MLFSGFVRRRFLADGNVNVPGSYLVVLLILIVEKNAKHAYAKKKVGKCTVVFNSGPTRPCSKIATYLLLCLDV